MAVSDVAVETAFLLRASLGKDARGHTATELRGEGAPGKSREVEGGFPPCRHFIFIYRRLIL